MRKQARIVFGPDLVVLGPHEDFNVLSLSGKFLDVLSSLFYQNGIMQDFLSGIFSFLANDYYSR